MPVAFSLFVHGVLLALVALGPARDLAQERRSLYAQVIAGKEKKLVWYRFRKLPEVSPGKTSSPKPPETEKLNSKQTIISKPPKAERAQQMVWRPAPQVNLKKELTSPNLLAFRPVLVAPPPPPPRVFTLPPVRRAPVTAATVPEAPALAASANTRNPALAQTRSFVPPPPKPRAVWVPAALPAAPSLAGSAAAKRAPGSQENLAAALDIKPVPKTFVPPQPRAGVPGGTGNGPVIQDAPNIADSLRPDHLNVAVVGLNPAEALNSTLPNASRPAEFSAGPRPTGGTEAGGSTGGSNITIPDLTIRGGDAPPKPVLLARVSPTSLSNLTAAARSPRPPSEPPSGSAAAGAPNPLWDHREVYQIDVQMPNVTSYVGSWIMWFAERQAPAGGRRELHLPKPLHKVDPKYIIAAIEERVEGKVQFAGVIRADGRVDELRLMKGLDSRLDQSAAEALLKWQFEPATLNGTPVDIDLMVEIPFRLAPRIAR